jgi:intracellular sulfur oxidation DsrE/DsrF family protein
MNEAGAGVVVHIDEPGEAKHQAVLRNVANLLDDLPGTTVEVVAHGQGIGLCLADSPVAKTVQGLLARGVIVAACENTLTGLSIERSALAAGVVTVPAGVGEVVRKQREGWSYLRP